MPGRTERVFVQQCYRTREVGEATKSRGNRLASIDDLAQIDATIGQQPVAS